MAGVVSKGISAGFLAGYCFLIISWTILSRGSFEGQHFQGQFFWSWRIWDVQREQILWNVIGFIPVGIAGSVLWNWKIIPMAAVFSLCIEIVQLVTQRGLMEFDDVIHNCLGVAIGCAVFMVVRKIRGEQKR